MTAEIVTFQVGGKATRCMKVVFEATTGQHQEPGPSGVELALPVPNIDDRWVIVALDLVPNRPLYVNAKSVTPSFTSWKTTRTSSRTVAFALFRHYRVTSALSLPTLLTFVYPR